MTTIKSFTDLEQSKILEKILPPESADGVIVTFGDREGTKTVVMPNKTLDIIRNPFSDIRETVNCWSLAALYNVLPNNKRVETYLSRGGWKIEPIEYLPNTWWCEYEDNESLTEFNVSAENSVDACYAMVLKLNGLGLL
jgi:hypothetical protein